MHLRPLEQLKCLIELKIARQCNSEHHHHHTSLSSEWVYGAVHQVHTVRASLVHPPQKIDAGLETAALATLVLTGAL